MLQSSIRLAEVGNRYLRKSGATAIYRM